MNPNVEFIIERTKKYIKDFCLCPVSVRLQLASFFGATTWFQREFCHVELSQSCMTISQLRGALR
jgi:hypothetical protein